MTFEKKGKHVGIRNFTHSNATDDHAQRKQEEIPYDEAAHPYETQSPRYELVMAIRTRQQVPILQFFGYETRRDLVFYDGLHSRFDIIQTG